eukprot:m.24583 g.24583  ORF g.24583 m.24583 type:complete len:195 (-) comp4172_c0_seq1:1484-2068(-)
MVLPVFKLGYIAAKQLAKPIGKRVVSYSHNNQLASTYVVQPLGQLAHWISVRSDRIIAGNWRTAVRPIPPEEALEWGSAVLSESFIFGVASGFVIYEYSAKEISDNEKKQQLEAWRAQVDTKTATLETQLTALQAEKERTEAALRAEIEALREQQQRSSWSDVSRAVSHAYSGTIDVASSVMESLPSLSGPATS